MIVNANSIVPHVIQIKNGTKINVVANLENIVRAKKIIFGILELVFIKVILIL